MGMTLKKADVLLREADMAKAYIDITKTQGPSQQLLDFINFDGSLKDDIGLEGYDTFSTLAQHEIFLSKLDSQAMEVRALEALTATVEDEDLGVAPEGDEEIDLGEIDTLTAKVGFLEQIQSRIEARSSYRAHLVSSTSMSEFGTEGLGAAIAKAAGAVKDKVKGLLKSLTTSVIEGIKKTVAKILDKIKTVIEKIKQKTIDLGKTIKAHPVKTLMIAVATIAAAAAAIYIYKDYSKGYNEAEKAQFEAIQALNKKMALNKVDMNHFGEMTKLTEREIRQLKREIANSSTPERLERFKKDIALFERNKSKALDEISFFEDRIEKTQSDLIKGLLSNSEAESRIKELKFKLDNTKGLVNVSGDMAAIRTANLKRYSPGGGAYKDLDRELAELEKYRTALADTEKFQQQTLKTIESTKSSWDKKNHSLYTRFNDILRGTFFEEGGVLKWEFDKSFPPRPKDLTSVAAGVTQTSLDSVGRGLNDSMGKLTTAIGSFASEASKDGVSATTLRILKAILTLIKEGVGGSLSFILKGVTGFAKAA